ncbi:glycosyltransferase family 2 protein [Cerasicoccus frondis]|uniref:glycosyltransferase family 2 protein n=1 Tax=Cerasicoccus frondis TaxID=490090 RepID=UPI0028526013|nr:glycosyltransferase family 2 protein [Cerasicoccus frondis]
MSPLDLTVVLPVRNEERNLGEALKALGNNFAMQSIVVDSSSTDRTISIAEEHRAKVINFEWDGKFPKKRNWLLRNHPPTTKWVLFLDADEWLTEDFKAEVRAALATTEHVGFWLNYTIYFEGKPLKGGYPLKKLALFRVGVGEYERIDENRWSQLDMEIHEHPVLDGTTGEIHAKIDHRDLRGLDHWKKKHADYAAWEAHRYLAIKDNSALQSKWSTFQKIKYRLMGTPLLGPVFFFGCLFGMGGWRDGKRGVQWALLKAGYFNEISRLVWAERKQK